MLSTERSRSELHKLVRSLAGDREEDIEKSLDVFERGGGGESIRRRCHVGLGRAIRHISLGRGSRHLRLYVHKDGRLRLRPLARRTELGDRLRTGCHRAQNFVHQVVVCRAGFLGRGVQMGAVEAGALPFLASQLVRVAAPVVEAGAGIVVVLGIDTGRRVVLKRSGLVCRFAQVAPRVGVLIFPTLFELGRRGLPAGRATDALLGGAAYTKTFSGVVVGTSVILHVESCTDRVEVGHSRSRTVGIELLHSAGRTARPDRVVVERRDGRVARHAPGTLVVPAIAAGVGHGHDGECEPVL